MCYMLEDTEREFRVNPWKSRMTVSWTGHDGLQVVTMEWEAEMDMMGIAKAKSINIGIQLVVRIKKESQRKLKCIPRWLREY